MFSKKEFTPAALVIGLLVGTVMTAANVYLGLYAGMTVSASIPAAVIGVAVLRLLQRRSILEANIIQTMASAGESVAAGVIFTIPALVLVGAWQGFHFWPTTLIAVCGSILGVVFMIPLRRALIIEEKELRYPEGVACATVLESATATDQSADQSGSANIFKGFAAGGLFKLLATGLKALSTEVAHAWQWGKSVLFVGSDMSPALLAVGYIVGIEIASMVVLGGALGWFVGLPLMAADPGSAALDNAWHLWSTQIRYMGVGAMVVGGLWSIFSVRQGIASGIKSLNRRSQDSTDVNINLMHLGFMFIATILVMLFLYNKLIGSFGLSVFTTLAMTVMSFLFVAVSSYVVGLVGSSNNPVSGMTISALLGTAAFFLVLGFEGESAILATLGVAAVVCCAACTASDCSQDLKTGVLVKATPKAQQWAQVIGVTLPTLVIAPVLTVLHSEYGIGEGLKAPQATLFASIVEGIFGQSSLPYNMIGIGATLGILVILLDQMLLKGQKFRLHLMPIAVGIYLPITLGVPIFIGGLVHSLVSRRFKSKNTTDQGVLFGSGLVAGEAIMGVVLAIAAYVGISMGLPLPEHHWLKSLLTMVAFAGVAWWLAQTSYKQNKG